MAHTCMCTYRLREREREIFYSLVHSPNGSNCSGQARLKLEAPNSIWVSHRRLRPKYFSYYQLPPRRLTSRTLNQMWRWN